MVPRDDRAGRLCWTVLVFAGVLWLASCTEEQPGPRTDSETHWLDSCVWNPCGAPYTCHCGVCTIGCVESTDCAAADPDDAACYSVAEPTCQGAEAAETTEGGGYCLAGCEIDDDCLSWGTHLSCIDRACVDPSGLVPPDFDPDAGSGDAAGETGSDGDTPIACGGVADPACPDTMVCDYSDDLCGTAEAEGTCRPRPASCPSDVDPVCACDRLVHDNACLARRAGWDVAQSDHCTAPDFVSNPVVYYPFDSCAETSPEAMGTGLDVTLFFDASCSARDALSTTLVTGWSSGTALALDGVEDYAEAPDDPAFEPDEITLSAWIYSDDYYLCAQGNINDECTILSKGNTDSYDGFGLGYRFGVTGGENGDGALDFSVAGNGGETNAPGEMEVTASTWHHVVATFDGSWVRTYLDGALHKFQYVSNGIEYGNESFLIGTLTDRNFDFNGLIDEVALWDFAMSDEEVATFYTLCDGSPTCPRADCDNGALDEGESDVDCGGVCGPCELGEACRLETDCPAAAHCTNDHCAPADFTYIPEGTFWMGSPDGCPGPDGFGGDCAAERGRDVDESPLHTVTLGFPFYLSTTPVTQSEWLAIMGSRPWTHADCDDCPVDVNWWDAIAYANAVSESEGLPECYTLSGCTVSEGENLECTSVTVNAPNGDPYLCQGYRLPTEAEWEYAYRAGTTTAFYNGASPADDVLFECSSDDDLDEIAWYCGNSGSSLHPVGLKEPNPWGLYDMAGNAGDWVWDYWGLYPSSLVMSPLGSTTGVERVVRGGGFDDGAAACRAASRDLVEPHLPYGSPRIARSVRPVYRDIYRGLRVYYPFDACTSTSPEAMRTGFDVTLVGTASCGARNALSTALGTSWSSGTALFLDGDRAYAEAADHPVFEPTELTFSAWVYSDDLAACDAAACTIVSKANTDSRPTGYRLDVPGTRELSLVIAGNGEETIVEGGGMLSNSTWHHVVATFDGSVAATYLDGELAASQTIPHGLEYGDESFLIGALTNRAFDFKGYIDEVALWGYAMTADEVAALYATCDDSLACPDADCGNDELDPGESDVDCGGLCDPCEVGRACRLESDCAADAHCADLQCAPAD